MNTNTENTARPFEVRRKGTVTAIERYETLDRSERDAAHWSECYGTEFDIWYCTPDGNVLMAQIEDGGLVRETAQGRTWGKANRPAERQHPESGYPDGRKATA